MLCIQKKGLILTTETKPFVEIPQNEHSQFLSQRLVFLAMRKIAKRQSPAEGVESTIQVRGYASWA